MTSNALVTNEAEQRTEMRNMLLEMLYLLHNHWPTFPGWKALRSAVQLHGNVAGFIRFQLKSPAARQLPLHTRRVYRGLLAWEILLGDGWVNVQSEFSPLLRKPDIDGGIVKDWSRRHRAHPSLLVVAEGSCLPQSDGAVRSCIRDAEEEADRRLAVAEAALREFVPSITDRLIADNFTPEVALDLLRSENPEVQRLIASAFPDLESTLLVDLTNS